MFNDKQLETSKKNLLSSLGLKSVTFGTTSESSVSNNSFYVDAKSLINSQDAEILYADDLNKKLNSYHNSVHYFTNISKLIELKEDTTSTLKKNVLLKELSANADSKLFYSNHIGFGIDDLKNVYEPLKKDVELKCTLLYNEIEHYLDKDVQNPYLKELSKRVDLKSVMQRFKNLEDISSVDALTNLKDVIVNHLDDVDNYIIAYDGEVPINGKVDIDLIARQSKDNISVSKFLDKNERKLSDSNVNDGKQNESYKHTV